MYIFLRARKINIMHTIQCVYTIQYIFSDTPLSIYSIAVYNIHVICMYNTTTYTHIIKFYSQDIVRNKRNLIDFEDLMA